MVIKICGTDVAEEVGKMYDKSVKYLCEHVNYPKWTYKEYPSSSFAQEAAEKNCLFVCLDNAQKAVGAFVLNDDPQGAYENVAWGADLFKGEYLVVHALAVDPDCARQGVGAYMTEFCICRARELGYKGLRLDVVPDNFPAKKLYEKCGFTYVGDADLERGIEEIPLFSLYELNF